MKCDGLKAETVVPQGTSITLQMYGKGEVDAAIAELKDRIQQKDFFWDGCGFSKMGFKNTIDVANYVEKLKAENERLKNELHYIDEVTEGQAGLAVWTYEENLRETKHALWLARANYCHNFRIDLYRRRRPGTKRSQSIMENLLIIAEMKCRKKAAEYE
jgi:hypothetical protein